MSEGARVSDVTVPSNETAKGTVSWGVPPNPDEIANTSLGP